MALIPLIQPPFMKLLTTKKERQVVMKQTREVSKTEKIIFPIVVTIFVAILLPSTAPLIGCLMLGNLFRECGARHCRIYLRTGCGELDRQRLEGLTEALEEARVVTDTAILGSGSLDWEPGIAAVALDAGTLAALAEKLPEEAPLYGMGVSGSVLELLEAGRICALAAVNEYDLGYLTLSAAAGLVSGRYQPPELLTPFLVTGEEMFDPPYAAQLVPMG